MNKLPVLLLVSAVALGGAARGAIGGELSFRSVYNTSKDELTTEKAWVLDQDEPNPHRQRWLLNRKVELVNLHTREVEGAPAAIHFAVAADGLDAVTTAYYRGGGPWYRGLTEFPCTPEPVSWFGDSEGVHIAADVAAKQWEQILDGDRGRLAVMLGRVRGISQVVVLDKARGLFDEWLKTAYQAWRGRGRSAAKIAEWRSYTDRARAAGICRFAGVNGVESKASRDRDSASDEYVPPTRSGPIPWEMMMEAPAVGEVGRAGAPEDDIKILSRAPAKLWDGLFTVRLSLTVAGRKLDGRFLIDSGTGTSVISPDFLEGQGIYAAWIEIPGALPRRVPWGGGESAGEGGLAPMGSVDLAEIGNMPLQLKDFAIFETDFFSPPENPSSCCDGVLGTDFLRHYVVELHPGPPAEVKLWPPESFHLAAEPDLPGHLSSQWIEAALTPLGETVSSCLASTTAGGGKQGLKLVGVRWDTAREEALDVHVPWQEAARGAIHGGANAWDLRCGPPGNDPVARAIPASFPRSDGSPESASIRGKVPAATVGMEILGRGRIFLDFPHGRIWFPDQTSNQPVYRDHSGLMLRYDFIKGKGDTRGLIVSSIKPGSPARALAAQGLRAGMLVTQIDKIDSGELDAWEVGRHLAGAYGPEVQLQWKTAQGAYKLGVLKVK